MSHSGQQAEAIVLEALARSDNSRILQDQRDFYNGSIFMFVDVESSQFVSLHSDLNLIPPQGAEHLVQAITQTPPMPCLTWWLPMGAAMIPSLIPLAFH